MADSIPRPVHLFLPFPHGVTTNHLYAARQPYVNPKTGKWVGAARRLTPKARAWRAAVEQIVHQVGAVLPEGPLCVEMLFLCPDRRRRDTDNLMKLTLDAIFGACGADDTRAIELHGLRIVWKQQPGIKVRIRSADVEEGDGI